MGLWRIMMPPSVAAESEKRYVRFKDVIGHSGNRPGGFGTKRLRSIGSDLGAAVKGFKQAMNDGESEEQIKQIKQDKDADFAAGGAPREAEVKVPPKTNA